jgi:hypothetical protein
MESNLFSVQYLPTKRSRKPRSFRIYASSCEEARSKVEDTWERTPECRPAGLNMGEYRITGVVPVPGFF